MMKSNTYAFFSCSDLLGLLSLIVRHVVNSERDNVKCGVAVYTVTRPELGDATSRQSALELNVVSTTLVPFAPAGASINRCLLYSCLIDFDTRQGFIDVLET